MGPALSLAKQEENEMADFDPMTLIREQLAEGVAAHMAPPTQALAISPWVAMSLLQKAIRRGHEAWALNAAATLLHLSPDRLWRRLVKSR